MKKLAIVLFYILFLNPAIVRADNPIIYFPFDDVTGSITTKDWSENGASGVIPLLSTIAGGINGTALTLNGASEFASVSVSASLNATTTKVGLFGWINPTNLSSVKIISQKGNITGSRNWIFAIIPSGQLHFNADGLSRGQDGLATWSWNNGDIQVSGEYFVGATYDGTVVKLYSNGKKIGERLVTDTLKTNSDPILIGKNIDGLHFAGWVDEFRVYNSAPTEDEVKALYNDGLAKKLALNNIIPITGSAKVCFGNGSSCN